MSQSMMTRPAAMPPVWHRQGSEEGPIVLATKPFDGTDAPLTVARWLARREERALSVVSVLEQRDALALSAETAALPPRYFEEEAADIAARMRATLASLSRDDWKYTVEVLNGPTAATIVDRARAVQARMIVAGTGRHDPLGRFVYGERALQIVRLTDRPVLIVPRDHHGGSFMNVVVAVDFSTASLRAARAVMPLLSEGSRVTLLHVRPNTPPAVRARSLEVRCDELFDRFRMQLHVLPGLTVETRVLWGDSATVIQEYAQRNHVDLIACGRRQTHSLIERFLIGSVSSALLRTVGCPILIAPEQTEADPGGASLLLTGLESWPRDEWTLRLRDLTRTHHDRSVRLSVEGEGLHGGRLVSQDYLLRTIAYEGQRGLTVLLSDSASENNLLSMKFADVAAIIAFTEVGGAFSKLVLDTPGGLVTLKLMSAELDN